MGPLIFLLKVKLDAWEAANTGLNVLFSEDSEVIFADILFNLQKTYV